MKEQLISQSHQEILDMTETLRNPTAPPLQCTHRGMFPCLPGRTLDTKPAAAAKLTVLMMVGALA